MTSLIVSIIIFQNLSNSFLPNLHAQIQDKITIAKILLDDALDAVKKKDAPKGTNASHLGKSRGICKRNSVINSIEI
jgi:hypothetical protein